MNVRAKKKKPQLTADAAYENAHRPFRMAADKAAIFISHLQKDHAMPRRQPIEERQTFTVELGHLVRTVTHAMAARTVIAAR